MDDLVRAHRGIAHKDQLVVRGILMQHVPGGQALGMTARVVLPDGFINAVVKVIVLKMLEFCAAGRKEFGAYLDVIIHRPARI